MDAGLKLFHLYARLCLWYLVIIHRLWAIWRDLSVQAYGEIQLSGCEREPVRISLGTGEHTQGYNPRYLSAGGESQIAYNLYQDAQHYIIWGDGQQSSASLLANAGTYRIYAKVEMGQFVAPGLYRDNVQVVLEW